MSSPMPPMGQNQMEKNRSPFNAVDATMMAQRGQIRQDMTVKDFIEQVIKVPLTAPFTELVKALKNQVAQKNPVAKAQSLGGQPPQAPPNNPQAQGGPPPQPVQRQQNIQDLLGRTR